MTTESSSAEISDRAPLTVRRAVAEGARRLRAAGVESAALDAEVLLQHTLEIGKTDLYLNGAILLEGEDERRFQALLLRRAMREPLAYITGRKEFWSLDFVVTPAALIPRPETELLVEIALERAKLIAGRAAVKILDLGTGSGAVAVSLARELPRALLWATDFSAGALALADWNSRRHGVGERIRFLRGDLLAPAAAENLKFDVIVSNPPYIRSADMETLEPEIRCWEPAAALDGGADGLDFYRRIIDQAHNYLAFGGHLALEIGAGMGTPVRQLFDQTGRYGSASIYMDYAGRERVVAAVKVAPPGACARDFRRG